MDYMIQSNLSRLGSLITSPKLASWFHLLPLSCALHTFHTFSLRHHLPPLLSSAFISNLTSSSESLHQTSFSPFRSAYIEGLFSPYYLLSIHSSYAVFPQPFLYTSCWPVIILCLML